MSENITFGRPDVTCSEEGCTNVYQNPIIGSREAAKHGWFIPNGQLNGRVDDRPKGWCPEHIPDWIPDWRKRQIRHRDDIDSMISEIAGKPWTTNELNN